MMLVSTKIPANAPRNAADLVKQARRLMASEAYYKQGHPDREDVVATVEKLFKAAYPEGSTAMSDPNFVPQQRS